jgi:hypothetical protein
MSVPVGPIVQAGLTVVRLLGNIKIRSPKQRAKAHRSKAATLRAAADALLTEIKRHRLNALNGPNEKFHQRQIRHLEKKRQRLNGRAVWWEKQADRIDPR